MKNQATKRLVEEGFSPFSLLLIARSQALFLM